MEDDPSLAEAKEALEHLRALDDFEALMNGIVERKCDHPFNSDCIDCAARALFIQTGDVKPPPGPSRDEKRPEESEAHETARKEAMQCQFCLKSKANGAALRRCTACQVAYYCVSAADNIRLIGTEMSAHFLEQGMP